MKVYGYICPKCKTMRDTTPKDRRCRPMHQSIFCDSCRRLRQDLVMLRLTVVADDGVTQ